MSKEVTKNKFKTYYFLILFVNFYLDNYSDNLFFNQGNEIHFFFFLLVFFIASKKFIAF